MSQVEQVDSTGMIKYLWSMYAPSQTKGAPIRKATVLLTIFVLVTNTLAYLKKVKYLKINFILFHPLVHKLT